MGDNQFSRFGRIRMEIGNRIIQKIVTILKKIVYYYDTSEEYQMHVCSLCGTMFLDGYSYAAHFTLNQCSLEMYPFSFDQLEIGVTKDE